MHAPTINTITLFSELINPNVVPLALVFSDLSILSRETPYVNILSNVKYATQKTRLKKRDSKNSFFERKVLTSRKNYAS